jgi:hypothetical protein
MHVGKNLNARSFYTEPIERLFSSLEKQHERNRVRSEHNAERNNCYLTNPRVMPNLLKNTKTKTKLFLARVDAVSFFSFFRS